MRVKVIPLFAAALLLAACETTPEETAATAGAGEAMAPARPAPTTGMEEERVAAIPGPEPGSQADLVASAGDRVFFDFDKYDIRPDAQVRLESQAEWLKAYPQVTAAIEGHCDERGTREYNLALGERRANAVKNYLVALGIDPNRLVTISYGKERPEVLGSNEWAWAQNRRAVLAVEAGPRPMGALQ
jgi:peptidoglycan-associated lipoprotein